jgi:hypothetical protein
MTHWLGQSVQLLEKMVVVLNVVLLVAEHDSVQVGEVSVQVDAAIVCAANQVVLGTLETSIFFIHIHDCLFCSATHRFCSQLPSVGVHAGQQMDAGGVNEKLDALVTCQVLLAQVVR